MRIVVKYCGNCNPEINSPRIISHLMRTLHDEIIFHPEGKKPADLLIIICGCRKACVDRPDVRAMGVRAILIKGRWIQELSCGEVVLTRLLLQKIESMKGKIASQTKEM
ncbi:MAG: hypothetical protein JSW70_09355 [Syntrophobacterales bacterium]|nr:MAG: hypothetical protein JSW70_09355 [Syntrophobacterales bacterium]